MARSLEGTVMAERASVDAVCADWDALAAARGLPLMSPHWLLAWWSHLAPKGADLRVVAVRDAGELVGLAPFYVVAPKRGLRVEYRLLGSGLGSPLAPLVADKREREVAEAISRALSQAQPRPDLIALHGTPLASRWHVALSDAWPSRTRPVSRLYRAPTYAMVSLEGLSLDGWLATRSSGFRSSMRRLKRRFEEAGGSWRLSTQATLERDIDTFLRLHKARWRDRRDAQESTFLAHGARMSNMLAE